MKRHLTKVPKPSQPPKKCFIGFTVSPWLREFLYVPCKGLLLCTPSGVLNKVGKAQKGLPFSEMLRIWTWMLRFFGAVGSYILIQILGCLAFPVACQDTGQSGGSVSIDTAIAVAQSLKNLRLEDPKKFSNHRCKRSTWFQTSKKTLMVSLANLFTGFFFIILYLLFTAFLLVIIGKKDHASFLDGGRMLLPPIQRTRRWLMRWWRVILANTRPSKAARGETEGNPGNKVLFSRWTANPRVLEVESGDWHYELGLLI